jgi:DNA helicase-2/ATP-dependent DNA helicase PcrA
MDWSPINFKADLNDEQYAAVTAPEGPALVLAGAGSGKTRTLTYRVAWLLLEKQVSPDQLLLLTFTNKAAREMTDRVRSLTGLGRPPRWGGTFHSIGGRLLRQYGEHIGIAPNYTIMDQSDSESLLTTVIKESDKLYLKNKDHPKPRVIASIYSYARNTRQPLSGLLKDRFPWQETLAGTIEGFVKLYETRKREQQVADYDDLLNLWLKLLQDIPEVREACRKRFPCILVDEYQDTNIIQAEIIDTIGAHHNIMAVGDDAQCIYTWRGANFENIRSFPERHPGTCIYKILTNYRSTPPILAMANNVLAMQPGDAGYPKELVPHRKGTARPCVVPVMDTRQQARFLVARIEALFDEGIALNDIAVLYRAHYQALDTQLEFTRRGIPFTITSGLRFFDQAHVKDLVAQLRLLANPSDYSALERVLCLLPRVGPATVRKCRKAIMREMGSSSQQSSTTLELFAAPSAARSFFQAFASEGVIKGMPADAREDFASLAVTLRDVQPLLEAEGGSPTEIVEQVLEGWYGDYIRTAYPDYENREDDLNSVIEFATRFDTMPELLAQLVLLNSETTGEDHRTLGPFGPHDDDPSGQRTGVSCCFPHLLCR